MTGSRILIVEDEIEHRAALKLILERSGHSVLGPAPDCASALELLWRERPDFAFVDIHLGSETCEAVLEECDLQDVPVIITAPDIDDLPSFVGRRAGVGKPVEAAMVSSALHR